MRRNEDFHETVLRRAGPQKGCAALSESVINLVKCCVWFYAYKIVSLRKRHILASLLTMNETRVCDDGVEPSRPGATCTLSIKKAALKAS